MQKNLSRKPCLAIISDTAMYANVNTFVYEPVLREVKYFSHMFSNIIWLGYGHTISSPPNTSGNIPSNIKFIILSPVGGGNIFDKLKVFIELPAFVIQIVKIIYKSDIIHIRGPSIPALLSIPISLFFPNKIFWHKYAGSWNLKSDAISYSLERWLLKIISKKKVVISENINPSKDYIMTWQNPCLSNNEIIQNNKLSNNKIFSGKFTFCFVGRLDKDKGFFSLLDAFKSLGNISWIDKVHCAGDTIHHQKIETSLKDISIPFYVHGLLSRDMLNKIYKESHFIILPTESEGFPKVLMEAASFGCIPIVPPLNSITTYINNRLKNGIVLSDINPEGIKKTILYIKDIKKDLKKISGNAMYSAKKFTYETYNQKIQSYILKEYYKKILD